MAKDEYWAASDEQKLARTITQKAAEYYETLSASGRIDIFRRSVRTYYGLDPEGGWRNSAAVTYGGDQGELAQLSINSYRNLAEHLLTMTTGSRPAFSARAVNNDQAALAQAQLAEGLIDFYLDDKNIEDKAIEVVESALIFGEGWLSITWNPAGGDAYGVQDVPKVDEEGEPVLDELGQPIIEQRAIYEGDIEVSVHGPLDIIRDISTDKIDLDWIVKRERYNRFDLAARHPEHSEYILSLGPSTFEQQSRLWDYMTGALDYENNDDVVVLTFYHRRTESMPQGRYTMVVGDRAVEDGPLPYLDLPCYPMIPSREFESTLGYSRMWDLLGIQQAMDSVATTILTNHDAFGVQNVIVPQGSQIEAEDLAGGLRMIQYNPAAGPPQPLNLLRIPSDSYQLLGILNAQMETLSGVNSVARGNPESSLKSGAALALVHSMAIQFNSGLQRGYGRMLEESMTGLVNILQMYATTPRLAEISGADARAKLEQFTGEDIASVRRIKVDMASPLMRTAAGRVELADKLLEKQVVTPAQYLEVVATGRLNPILEGPEAELTGIRKENELLMGGTRVRAVPTDNHATHIQEHKALYADPAVRFNEELMSAILDHIQEHAQMAQEHPALMELTGQPPLQTAPPAPPGPPAGGSGEGPLFLEGAMPQTGPAVGMPGEAAEAPQMPVNPATGERYNPANGGIA